MPYHREHHAWPYVPFHQLPAANALLVAATFAEAGAAAAAAAAGCDPPGARGYLSLNLAFMRKLWAQNPIP